MLHEILANITIAIPQLPANDVLTLTVLNRLFPGIGGAVIEPLVTSQFACLLIFLKSSHHVQIRLIYSFHTTAHLEYRLHSDRS